MKTPFGMSVGSPPDVIVLNSGRGPGGVNVKLPVRRRRQHLQSIATFGNRYSEPVLDPNHAALQGNNENGTYR